jgi:hypothetical protein
MPTTDYQQPVGQAAVFSGEWLRFHPTPGHSRFVEGYVGVLAGWCNGEPEFTVDPTAAAALAATFDASADYVAGCWRTVAFDGRVLTVKRPRSLGGGIHVIEPVSGRYLVGWNLAWHRVDPARCDRVLGTA